MLAVLCFQLRTCVYEKVKLWKAREVWVRSNRHPKCKKHFCRLFSTGQCSIATNPWCHIIMPLFPNEPRCGYCSWQSNKTTNRSHLADDKWGCFLMLGCARISICPIIRNDQILIMSYYDNNQLKASAISSMHKRAVSSFSIKCLPGSKCQSLSFGSVAVM